MAILRRSLKKMLAFKTFILNQTIWLEIIASNAGNSLPHYLMLITFWLCLWSGVEINILQALALTCFRMAIQCVLLLLLEAWRNYYHFTVFLNNWRFCHLPNVSRREDRGSVCHTRIQILTGKCVLRIFCVGLSCRWFVCERLSLNLKVNPRWN